MADQAESSRRAPPMTPPPPPPPSPAIPDDSSSEAILWVESGDCSSSTPHTDLLSLWLSNYTALPQHEGVGESLAVVPTLLNFDLESSFRDLVDWNTTSAAVTTAPVVTQSLWVQLHGPAAGEMDDLSRLALGIQSPKASISPLALGIQSPKTSILPLALGVQLPEPFVSPLALGTQPSSASFQIETPQVSLSPLALGLQPPQASSGIQSPQASISPLALGLQLPPASFGIQYPKASIVPLAAIPCTLPMAPPLWNLPSIPCTLPMAPPLWNLPSIPCTLPMAPPLRNLSSFPWTLPMPPPLWNLSSIRSTMPMAPPLWNFLQNPSPVPERGNWSVFPSRTPPARRQLLLPHSASASLSSSSSHSRHPNHQPHHFFPAVNTGYQQRGPIIAHTPVTFSTPNANSNSIAGFVFASRRPSWSPRGSWTPNQPWISNSQGMKLPIPRRRRFVLRPAAATMPAPPPRLANFGSSVGNMPNWNARGNAPVGDHQRVETGESSTPSRKRSKLALDLNDGEASQWNRNGVVVVPIARENFALGPALNRNGQMRALPGTAIDFQSLFSRYKREKIKQRVKILQRLVPNGDKAEMVLLLEQAHLYIRFLEQQIKLLKSKVDWKLAAPFVYNNMDLLKLQ